MIQMLTKQDDFRPEAQNNHLAMMLTNKLRLTGPEKLTKQDIRCTYKTRYQVHLQNKISDPLTKQDVTPSGHVTNDLESSPDAYKH